MAFEKDAYPASVEAQKIAHVGLSEAAVLFQRIASYRDPRLYAMSLLAEQLSKSTQPLVPERVFVAGGAGGDGRGPVRGVAAGHSGVPQGRLVDQHSRASLDDLHGAAASLGFVSPDLEGIRWSPCPHESHGLPVPVT